MTRMWFNIEPEKLCSSEENNHMLGERGEIPKAIGGFLHHPHGVAMTRGQIQDGNLDFSKMEERHEKLSTEAKKRGYKHDTTLVKYWSILGYLEEFLVPEKHADSVKDLSSRCGDCRV
jgi:hypothetical protein